MTKEEAIKLIKKHKPTNADGFIDLGFKLKYLGEGAFRTAYELKTLGLVVKIPHRYSNSNVEHSQYEIDAYLRIKGSKKFKAVAVFLPKIHWFHYGTGVIVMEKYQKAENRVGDAAAETIEQVVRTCYKMSDGTTTSGDIHRSNIGYTYLGDESWEPRHWVILDLGCFEYL